MGRFKSKQPPTQPVQFPVSTPNSSGGCPPQQMGMPPQQQMGQQGQYNQQDWPTSFPKSTIGIDRDGVILEWKDWESLQEKIKRLDYPFLVEPKIRFKSKPGEQGTFFISDPSGNALEFKTFKHDSMVFEKFG